jgi:hypothetical protein
VALILGGAANAWGEQPAASTDPSVDRSTADRVAADTASRAGVGVRVSTLGFGVEVGVAVHARANVRVGVNMFQHSDTFNYHGIDYTGPLIVRSFDAHVDWFSFGGQFHVSPGAVLYNGNKGDLRASAPPGRPFTLGDTSYVSDICNPVSGSVLVDFRRTSPTFLVGWSDLLSGRHRHFSVPFEAGFVFEGAPSVSLNLGGSACLSTGAACRSVAADAGIQNDVRAEQERIRTHEATHLYLRVYPVASMSVRYRF